MSIVRENIMGQPSIKLFGYVYPKKEETAACKFTSFFRQIMVVNEKDKSTIETVDIKVFSGKNQLQLF